MSEHNDESVNYGWVIEGAWSHVQSPDYWVGSSAWSQDHNRALRFARKQDAEQAAAMMLDGIRVRICEHVWTRDRAPAAQCKQCGQFLDSRGKCRVPEHNM